MAKYRKKPIVIDAVQFDGTQRSVDAFVNEGFKAPLTNPNVIFRIGGGECLIATLEGTMKATSGDWIIRGVKGELYPCKADIFAATYESAT